MLETAVKNWRLAWRSTFNCALRDAVGSTTVGRIFCCLVFCSWASWGLVGQRRPLFTHDLNYFLHYHQMKSDFLFVWKASEDVIDRVVHSVTWKLIALGIKVHIVFKAFQAFPLSQIKLFDIQTRLKMLCRSKNAIQSDLVMQRLEFEF